MSDQNNWTFDECKTVFDDFTIQGASTLQLLKGRSYAATVEKAKHMGLEEQKPFTTEELDFIKAYAPSLGTAVCFMLPGHSPEEIRIKICTMSAQKH